MLDCINIGTFRAGFSLALSMFVEMGLIHYSFTKFRFALSVSSFTECGVMAAALRTECAAVSNHPVVANGVHGKISILPSQKPLDSIV
jgi:hypothetical protein